MNLCYITLLCLLLAVAAIDGNYVCHKGEYLNANEKGESICSPCPPDLSNDEKEASIYSTCVPETFMDQSNHQNTECVQCSIAEYFNNHEVVVQPCNPTTNTVIGCEEEYFRTEMGGDLINDGVCRRCKDCKQFHLQEVKPCSLFENTVCSQK